ncbi:MAG: hypothetical protein ACOCUL_00370 [Bacteroidota bacterium]
MKKAFFVYLLVLIVLSSCDPNKIYHKNKRLSPNIEWLRSKKVEFNPSIVDTAVAYDVYFSFRHHTYYPHDALKIKVTKINPSGSKSSKDYTLILRDGGTFKSKGAGDYWDYMELVEDNFLFEESGQYTYIVEHDMDVDPLTHVFDFGLIIKRDPIEKN